MRSLLAPIALSLALCAAARADDVSFKRVWPEWHDSDSFQSFYEDHTGQELTGKWIVLRSQPRERSGLYFLTRVENKASVLRGATFVVRVITTDAIDTKTFSFPATVPGGSKLFEIGLTGTDWKGARFEPVAWEVELDAADGRVLARKTSYLWEKPER
jgi:hypothetical protein